MCATAKGARLNNMVPVPRVPKTNGEIPSFDEAFSDHRRLLDKLVLYGLVELTVNGDDNCQFWALSDQFYRTPEHRRFVRQQVVNQGFGGDADGRREVHGLGGVVDADGAGHVYDGFLRPLVAWHEDDIDRGLLDLRARARDVTASQLKAATAIGQVWLIEAARCVSSQLQAARSGREGAAH
ncbi:hypothetical protein VPH35_118517 [Triticum aestivum]